MRSKPTARSAGALALLLAGSAALSACASDPTAAKSSDGKAGHAVTLGLTYIPNIQFAPFYVAESKGFYRDAGLKVTLRHHSFTDDLFGALTAGQEDVVYAGGDEMLQAHTKDVPVVDIATLYHTYPVAMLVPQDSPIHRVEDLRGRTVGTPGPYGETWFGLLAQLKAGGLTTKDVTVQHIGFTQQAALVGKKVDAVMGYLNNDAVQFQQAGLPSALSRAPATPPRCLVAAASAPPGPPWTNGPRTSGRSWPPACAACSTPSTTPTRRCRSARRTSPA